MTIILNADTDDTAAALVATIRSAVNGTKKYAAYVAARTEAGTPVTRETVKDHALALAVLTYPSDNPVQKKDGTRTRFGNAVQAAGNGLRGVLSKDESDETSTDWLNKIRKDADKAIADGVNAADVLACVEAWAESVLS